MEENATVALHKKAHSAAQTGDMETLTEMIAEDVIWHSHGKGPFSGDFQGRDAVLTQFFGTMAELSDGTAGFEEIHNYFGSGDYSAAFFDWTATRNGNTTVVAVCEIIRWRNGQIVEEWGFIADQYEYDEFWTS